mmetsp:Transcript_1543/g.1968  ORF Transcript_1543/g.1968 Transcript_1543/m.1968 type:complete len:225 (+) Transcript_1543:129-803(+)|eukprot:CAMPEP_0172505346 /NCGR_PEP_ID=MMETSP1066-20121228/185635_1 /TAXON_ID=671091 /ORGANISM="Coscinodiscus wailesii, Strain CCMP2513" /LENGTH=224 /DNA_ID=CAMNT_0013281919 /DNA_START=128 /DNA_END=802 /DNA_ORIENTATION=-
MQTFTSVVLALQAVLFFISSPPSSRATAEEDGFDAEQFNDLNLHEFNDLLGEDLMKNLSEEDLEKIGAKVVPPTEDDEDEEADDMEDFPEEIPLDEYAKGMLKDFDYNQDGNLTKVECLSALMESWEYEFWKFADGDEDGYLDNDKFDDFIAMLGDEGIKFDDIDKNSDGKISKVEASDFSEKILETTVWNGMDTNKDDIVVLEEIKAFVLKRQQEMNEQNDEL